MGEMSIGERVDKGQRLTSDTVVFSPQYLIPEQSLCLWNTMSPSMACLSRPVMVE